MGCHTSRQLPTGPSESAEFVIAGQVRDTTQQPVASATVEIVDGPLAGRSTTTNNEGRFAFSGSPSRTVTVSVTKDGYSSATTRVGENRIILLTPVTLIDLTGEYTGGFAAAASCVQIPAPFRTRTYTATVRRSPQYAPAFMGELRDADFYRSYGAFWGVVSEKEARLFISSWDAFNRWLEDLPIFEHVAPNGYLSLFGVVIASVADRSGLDAADFDGTFAFCEKAFDDGFDPPRCAVTLVECKSSAHRITLKRVS